MYNLSSKGVSYYVIYVMTICQLHRLDLYNDMLKTQVVMNEEVRM
jgi:hypothetical protein